MLRLALAIILLVGLVAPATSQTATISEIGIQGFYNSPQYWVPRSRGSAPVRVGIHLSNPRSTAVALDIRLSVAERGPRFPQTDHYTASLTLQPSESRSLDLPVPFQGASSVLDLEVMAGGQVVAHQTKTLESHEHNALVMFICSDDKACNITLGAITASGTDEDKIRKTKRYTFFVLKNLPEAWWIYDPASMVVLASPASRLTATQRDALEGYLRHNGRLLLLDPVVGPGFLDAYRTSDPSGAIRRVGDGELLRFTDNADLASFFDRSVRETADKEPENLIARFRGSYGSYGFDNTFPAPYDPFVTAFEFPTLGWLIFWICTYILVVGVVNFVVLTRIRRRDLAWVTVPAIALIFACGLYFMSAAKRPRTIELDEMGSYIMDDVQPLASATVAMRVSSPRPASLKLAVPGDAVWHMSGKPLSPFAGFSVFDRESNVGDGWSVRLAPQREFTVPLLQWSFQDMTFSGLRTFPGTVRPLDGDRLANQTGLTFREAVLLDKDVVYDLGAVAAGAVVDGHHGVPEDLKTLLMKWTPPVLAPGEDPLSHENLRKYLAGVARENRASFAGFADASVLDAALPGASYVHRHYVVVIVAFGNTP